MTDETDLATLRDFAGYARAFWRITDKAGLTRCFVLNPVQAGIWHECKRLLRDIGHVRLNILKARQQGVSTVATAMGLHHAQTHSGHNCLSLAHREDLPATWLRRARKWREQTPADLQPSVGATNRSEIWYDLLGSRYYIGSVKSPFPGMGDAIHFVHLSEVASWPMSPICIDPVKIMADLGPSIPSGVNASDTWVIRESTGRFRNDYWYNAYHAGKAGEDQYSSLFFPWFLSPEYSIPGGGDGVDALTPAERDLEKVAASCGVELSREQLAWRRGALASAEFSGDEALFANQFPATEEEAFLAHGLSVFTAEQVGCARKTIRSPVWKGDFFSSKNPAFYQLSGNESGQLWLWDHDPKTGAIPNPRWHYVIGADCQWGTKEGADYDAAYVQCLETGLVCARMWGRFDMAEWGRMLASLGFYYNIAALAPERNAKASTLLMPLLLGAVAEWKYPNVWVRSDDITFRKPFRPEDFGWLTNHHTKGELVQFAKTASLDGSFDWCDAQAVDEMGSYVRNEAGELSAPMGAHDDCLMARMITAYVGHRLRGTVELDIPKDIRIDPDDITRSASQRIREYWQHEDAEVETFDQAVL